jgi:hypothetical protein
MKLIKATIKGCGNDLLFQGYSNKINDFLFFSTTFCQMHHLNNAGDDVSSKGIGMLYMPDV